MDLGTPLRGEKVVKPASKKPVVTALIDHHQLSERRACYLVGLRRTGYRYQSLPRRDEVLTERLKTLAVEHSRYGYRLLHGLLKAEGLVVNKKRTYRIYTEQGLQVRTKKRKKLQRPRLPMLLRTKANERWSMDFVSDQRSLALVGNVHFPVSATVLSWSFPVSAGTHWVAGFPDFRMFIR